MGVLVYLDETEENLIPSLALHAEHVLPERWNGWLRPVATAEAFGAFLDAWRQNDPNGVWGHVTELDDRLLHVREDGNDDTFEEVGTDDHGARLFDLTGLVWVTGPQ